PTSTPNAFLTRAITCVASSECPPISKKFSPLLTFSTFSTSSHIPPMISSYAVLGSSSSLPPSLFTSSGLGNAPRSTFPFLVSGIPSSFPPPASHMYTGSLSPTYLLSPSSLAPSSFSSSPSSSHSSSLPPIPFLLAYTLYLSVPFSSSSCSIF